MPARPAKRTPKPLVLRGVLFTLRRRCGKTGCRCATGDLHESPALAHPEGGRTKTLTLTGVDLGEVRAALERYRRAKAELDRSADAGVVALRARRDARRTTGRA
ncbi:MAG: DUF6788 family protein [Acidimicrobiales bacterium]